MKKLNTEKIISVLLLIFALAVVLPACSSTRIVSSSDESRRSLMLGDGADRYKGKRVSTAKASRSYKRSKKRSNMYKKSKHNYKKKKMPSRRRR